MPINMGTILNGYTVVCMENQDDLNITRKEN
jgi:hypothetical protein